MKKVMNLLLIGTVAMTMMGTPVLADVLSAKTPVEIQSEKTLTKNTVSVGDNVYFRVAKNVTDANGKVVITAGTPVSGVVAKVKSRARLGRPGEITINSMSTTTINGITVPIATEINKKAKSKMGLSITLSAVIIPFFLLMHGKDVEIPQGYTTTVYTFQNIEY